MRNRLKPDNGDFNNAQYTSIRLDDIRTDWRVSVANIRVVARRDPGARRLRALVDSIWDGIVADAGKYGTGFDGPAFSRDVREMLSGTGYIYTTRNFDVFRLADVIEIRDARLDDVSGRDCVRFVVVADVHDGPFASAEILQWLGDEGGSCPRNPRGSRAETRTRLDESALAGVLCRGRFYLMPSLQHPAEIFVAPQADGAKYETAYSRGSPI